MSQAFRYPSNSASVSISAVGTNDAAAPATSIQIGGQDVGGILRPLLTDADGKLQVEITESVLPTGAATAANQVLELAELADINTSLASIDVSTQVFAACVNPVGVLQVGGADYGSGGNFVAYVDSAGKVHVAVEESALPSGAATSAKQDTGNASLSSIDGKIAACNTGAVVVASSALPSGAATEATLSTLNSKVTACNTGAVVVASSALPSGAATDTVATANGVLIGAVNESAPGTDTASSGLNGRLQRIAQRLTSLIALIPASLGQKTMANSFAVAIASDQSALSTSEVAASTGTASNVASSASNVTILASNSSRKGATIFNDSTAVLYIKFGATASATSYAVQIPSMGYYEVPFKYTGIIDGIWAAANGNARVTELT
jgi:hypothetical protein